MLVNMSNACHKAYEAYKKEWQKSEDEPPDHLVWCDAFQAGVDYARKQQRMKGS